MAPRVLGCVVLQLFLLSNAQHYLTIHPVDPVVSIGGSLQLNCSINCPLGNVVWKGLDNTDNGQHIASGYSVQTLRNISISMEGTKICVGNCPLSRNTYQKSVQLYVYALPKMLLLSNSLKNGVHYLNCSMERVYPPPDITCYRGSEMLGDAVDINEVADGDNLYNVTWSWVIPEKDRLSETSYRCEAQVRVNEQVMTREGTLKISSKDSTTAVPASSTSHITSTLSWKPEDTTIGRQQSTISGKYTKTSGINIFITQSTRPPMTKATRPPIHRETTAADPATSQITSAPSQEETPYVTTTISASHNPHTMAGAQERNAIESEQATVTGEYTKTPIINTVTPQSARPTPPPIKPHNIDGLYLMWTIAPATGLVGAFLLSLQIYRQLSRKGFFRPNQTESSTVKKDAKSQGSLQAVLCYDVSPKEALSTC